MVQPTELLENLGVVGRVVEDALISRFSAVELKSWSVADQSVTCRRKLGTYVFLLLVDVANLKPDVLLCQGARRGMDNVFEALLTNCVS